MTQPNPAVEPIADVLRARLRAYREFLEELDRVDHPTPLDFARAYAEGRGKLQAALRELAVVPTPAERPAASPSVPGDDAPPPVDPTIAALFRPPYQPHVLQLHVTVHVDPDGLWAEVPELPGLFATGETAVELGASLGEAAQAYLIEHTTIVSNDPTSQEEP